MRLDWFFAALSLHSKSAKDDFDVIIGGLTVQKKSDKKLIQTCSSPEVCYSPFSEFLRSMSVLGILCF